MPGTLSEGPAVSLSFANNFWGKEDAGVQPLLERMHNAKVTADELKAFYNSRAAIEDEYARKLLALCRKPLGSCEAGTLRASLDTVRGEVESMGKAHQSIAGQIKSELEEPLAAQAGGMKERRKIVQSGIEKILKVKIQQTNAVNKSRDRYEQDCLRIKGYLAQGHMVMGQEERKNRAKLEKTQIHLATANTEYENAVKALEETTVRWNREWKAACDKFQDLEEERLDFMKSSLWSFANIASTVCVSDDASCEKIRLSLEGGDVEQDISIFIKERGTGQEIPDPPKYINFCRGDVNDSQSEASEEESYSVAQFQRTINPAFRTSSPQPSTYESHHDPQPRTAPQFTAQGHVSPTSEKTASMQKTGSENVRPPQPDYQGQALRQAGLHHRQQEPLPVVPHNEYPMDGMTMYCRTAPPSERSSATSPARPSSRDSESEYSNPTSFSSQEQPSGKQSPVKQSNIPRAPAMSEDKQIQKRKSGFFQNHSPFRRRSKHEKDARVSEPPRQYQAFGPNSSARNTWSAAIRVNGGAHDNSSRRTQLPARGAQGAVLGTDRQADSPEPVDPRANFQLNVGNNVFDVATPDDRKDRSLKAANEKPQEDLDPIAQALAELKGVSKQSSVRMSADRYHGLQTPAPSATPSGSVAVASPAPPATQQITPPPSYDQPIKRLDAPQPAFTSAQMQQTRQKYVDQRQNMFGASSTSQTPNRTAGGGYSQTRPGTRGSGSSQDIPRALSPAPPRSVSPRPAVYEDQRPKYRSLSPNPSRRAPRSTTHSVSPQKRDSDRGYFGRHDTQTDQARRGSGEINSSQLQLAPVSDNQYSGSQQGLTRYEGNERPMSYYGGQIRDVYALQPQKAQQDRRVRSKSVSDGRQFTSDGRPILHYARALYMYQAAIPEELSFAKGDMLAVLRHQNDGWWEAEVTGKSGRPGLVPSNYLQNC